MKCVFQPKGLRRNTESYLLHRGLNSQHPHLAGRTCIASRGLLLSPVHRQFSFYSPLPSLKSLLEQHCLRCSGLVSLSQCLLESVFPPALAAGHDEAIAAHIFMSEDAPLLLSCPWGCTTGTGTITALIRQGSSRGGCISFGTGQLQGKRGCLYSGNPQRDKNSFFFILMHLTVKYFREKSQVRKGCCSILDDKLIRK